MKTNVKARAPEIHTHEGARAYPHLTPLQQLRRSVLSCLLWEKEFYEDGASIAQRINDLADKVDALPLASLAVEARTVFKLRHVPLLLLVALMRKRHGTSLVAEAISDTVQRADEVAELLALYWQANPAPAGKKHAPLPNQLKKGLAAAIGKFDAYQLGKYNRDNVVKLRDVLFLVHAKPKGDAQAAIFQQLAENTLPAPDTWEVSLSGGKDKKATWTRLLQENRLGYLALLRNLRNMMEANVDTDLVREAIIARKGAENVLPFRYVAAARACPQLEPALDQALLATIKELTPLSGRTVVLVDVSGSMDQRLSAKSDLKRVDAAATLAAIIGGDVRMFSFSERVVEVPPRRGMAGVEAVVKSQHHGGTRLFEAVDEINRNVPYDRLIVITDEQAHYDVRVSDFPAPKARGYCINVASAQNGVGYGKWVHLDGFSERVLRFIYEHEAENPAQ